MIKTWEDRYDPDGYIRGAARTKEAAMQAEINELRTALAERDAEIERLNAGLRLMTTKASANLKGWQSANSKVDEQRKVLEQALEAFTETISMYLEWHKDFPEHVGDKEIPVVQLAKAAITAIQELK